MHEFNFAKRLAQLRNQKNISAREMSLDIGQNQNYINNIENNKMLPSMSGFFYICDYLKIEPKDFFDADCKYPAELSALINNLNKLDSNTLKHIAFLVEDLSNKNK